MADLASTRVSASEAAVIMHRSLTKPVATLAEKTGLVLEQSLENIL